MEIYKDLFREANDLGLLTFSSQAFMAWANGFVGNVVFTMEETCLRRQGDVILSITGLDQDISFIVNGYYPRKYHTFPNKELHNKNMYSVLEKVKMNYPFLSILLNDLLLFKHTKNGNIKSKLKFSPFLNTLLWDLLHLTEYEHIFRYPINLIGSCFSNIEFWSEKEQKVVERNVVIKYGNICNSKERDKLIRFNGRNLSFCAEDEDDIPEYHLRSGFLN